jgi:hypothetical protein
MRRLTILLLFFAIAIPSSGQQKTIVINEFMADNASTIADESGKFEDWIEIYNYGDEAVNIGGCYITDNYLEPKLFRLREGNDSTIIQPKSYLLLWADDDWEEGILHLEFKLSRQGEQIAIYDADGSTLIDSVSFQLQLPDQSFGRLPDGQPDWTDFDRPTPGSPNAKME